MQISAASGWDCHVHVFDADAKVAAGHYMPQFRPLFAIQALAQGHGFGHLVLVQPSVYGTDNQVLLHALQAQSGRHRGVVVVDPSVSDTELADMNALGVRGVRFNLVSPTGNSTNAAADFFKLAPRLQALGWHVQWYAKPSDLPMIAALHETSGVVPVLDHLAGLHAQFPVNQPGNHSAWQALEKLGQIGAWVKLSGWYRLQSEAPYSNLNDPINRITKLFAGRIHLLGCTQRFNE